MSFKFGNLAVTAKKADLDIGIVKTPLIYKKGEGLLTIVVGEYSPVFDKLFPQLVSFFEEVVYKYSPVPEKGFQILYGLRTQHATFYKPLEKDIVDTYKRNSWSAEELLKYIHPDCPFILTAGRGIYSITKSNELQAKHFYDWVFNKTYFYAPDLNKFIFPIEPLNSMLRKLTTNFAAKSDYDAIKIDKVLVGTDKKTQLADVYQTNHALLQIQTAFSEYFELRKKAEEYKYIPEVVDIPLQDPQAMIEALSNPSEYMSLDLETSGFDFITDEIGDVTFAYNKRVGYHILYKDILNNPEVLKAFYKAVTTKKLIGSNLKFDLKFIRYKMEHGDDPEERDWGPLNMKVYFDTNVSGHVLNENRSQSLKSLVWSYTPYGGYNRELDDWLDAHPLVKNYLEIPDDIRIPYAAKDAAITFYLFEVTQDLIMNRAIEVAEADALEGKEDSVNTLYEYFRGVMNAYNVLYDIEYHGVCVNIDSLREQGKWIREHMTTLECKFKEALKEETGVDIPDFSVTSSTQLGKVFEEVGYPCIKRGKAGGFSTDDNTLSKWVYKGYEAVKYLQEYRSWGVALNTFIGEEHRKSGWWQHLKRHEEDKENVMRMHPVFAPMTSDTGRCKCRNPNLQNIFSHGALAKRVKAPLCPPDENYYQSEADYSGFQLRIAAIQSGDPTLVDVYSKENADDLHSITAMRIFGNREFTFDEVEVTYEDGTVETMLECDYQALTNTQGV